MASSRLRGHKPNPGISSGCQEPSQPSEQHYVSGDTAAASCSWKSGCQWTQALLVFQKTATQMEKKLVVFQIFLLKRLLILRCVFLLSFIKIISPYSNSFIPWPCILFHWSMSLTLAECHSDDHTFATHLKSVTIPALFFELKIAVCPYLAGLYKFLNVYMFCKKALEFLFNCSTTTMECKHFFKKCLFLLESQTRFIQAKRDRKASSIFWSTL